LDAAFSIAPAEEVHEGHRSAACAGSLEELANDVAHIARAFYFLLDII